MRIRPIDKALLLRWVEHADTVGRRRRVTAIACGSKHTNGWRPNPELAMWKNRQAARCELAARLWLNPITWNEYQVGGADLGDFIDVKGVEEAHHKLLVPLDAKDDFAYLLVDSWRHPVYAIVGWVWGYEGKKHPIKSLQGEDRPCHVVERSYPPLRDPLGLLAEVQRRRR